MAAAVAVAGAAAAAAACTRKRLATAGQRSAAVLHLSHPIMHTWRQSCMPARCQGAMQGTTGCGDLRLQAPARSCLPAAVPTCTTTLLPSCACTGRWRTAASCARTRSAPSTCASCGARVCAVLAAQSCLPAVRREQNTAAMRDHAAPLSLMSERVFCPPTAGCCWVQRHHSGARHAALPAAAGHPDWCVLPAACGEYACSTRTSAPRHRPHKLTTTPAPCLCVRSLPHAGGLVIVFSKQQAYLLGACVGRMCGCLRPEA